MRGGNGQAQGAILAPQDFYRPREGEARLDLFLSGGWLEWIATENGCPKRMGSLRQAELEGEAAAVLGAEARKAPHVHLWLPEGERNVAGRLAGILGLGSKDVELHDYESSAGALLSKGGNSFGPKKNSRRRWKALVLLVLSGLDLALLLTLLLRGPLAANSECLALRAERMGLSASISEAAALRKKIAEFEALSSVRTSGKPSPYRILEELSLTLPDEALLSAVEIQGKHFRITGSASHSFDLLARLEESGKFEGLGLDQSSPIEGSGRYHFAISGSMGHE